MQGDAWLHIDTRHALAFSAIQVGLALLVLTTAVRCPPERRRYLLASYAVAFLAYLPGLTGVEALKHALDDWECHSEHSNAVSGHAYYYVWVLATYQHCAQLLGHVRVAGEATTAQVSWLVLVFSLLCLAPQAFFTYYYGYHSIQQILLGAIVVRIRASVRVGAGEGGGG